MEHLFQILREMVPLKTVVFETVLAEVRIKAISQ